MVVCIHSSYLLLLFYCMRDHSLFIHSPTDDLDRFGAVMSEASKNIHIRFFLWTYNFHFSWVYTQA